MIIKPCPKCGAEEKYITVGSWHIGMWGKETHYVLCEQCGFIIERNAISLKSSLEVWNEMERK
jgi:transcription elongation factor Elf1